MAENGKERLESWKEIADFLGCDERTAMRYEKDRGMPVSRVPGGKMGRVFAYKTEIQEWMNPERKSPLLTDTVKNVPPSRKDAEDSERKTPPGDTFQNEALGKKPRWVYGVAAGAAIAVMAVVILKVSGGSKRMPARAVIEGSTLRAIDERGETLWSYAFGKTPEPNMMHSPLDNFIRVEDLETNGEREVLAVLPTSAGPNVGDPSQTEVMCFSSTGKLKWKMQPDRRMKFGEHELHGPWVILDMFVSSQETKPRLWAAFGHYVWGNNLVEQLDAATGRETLRFVNTGNIYALNEMSVGAKRYLVAGGFNNEYAAGSIAIVDEKKPFAASPQTAGTRHFCVSCPAGEVDYYVVFPRSEINIKNANWENSITTVRVKDNEIEVVKSEIQSAAGTTTIYRLLWGTEVTVGSLRYDSGYDMLHKQWSAEGKLDHTLENCPERLHPKPVRVWTPSGGWKEVSIKPARADE